MGKFVSVFLQKGACIWLRLYSFPSIFFLFHPHIDPCLKTKCEYHARCLLFSHSIPKCICPICNDEGYTPVCGDNGQTYANTCWMSRHSCQTKKLIKLVKHENCGVKGSFDVMYAVDSSDAMDIKQMAEIRHFINALLPSYANNSGVNNGLIAYSDRITQYLAFNDDQTKRNVMDALLNLRPSGGGRDINSMLNYIKSQVFYSLPGKNKRVLVLFTTAKDDVSSVVDVIKIASELRNKEVRIIVVVFGSPDEIRFPYEITTSKQDVIFIDGSKTLPEVLGDIEILIGQEQGKFNGTEFFQMGVLLICIEFSE